MRPDPRFISFEGIDGCGKSTQTRLLAADLRAAGRDVVLTREPGGSPGAEEIRRLVLEGPPARWSAMTELLLFMAARRDHVERVIRPALEAGRTVITDRFADSTRVYQGRGDGRAQVEALHDLAIGIEPDLTVLIDLDAETGRRRSLERLGAPAATEAVPEDRFEAFGDGFQRDRRRDFLDLAAQFPDRIAVIDGSGSSAEVAARVRGALAGRA